MERAEKLIQSGIMCELRLAQEDTPAQLIADDSLQRGVRTTFRFDGTVKSACYAGSSSFGARENGSQGCSVVR